MIKEEYRPFPEESIINSFPRGLFPRKERSRQYLRILRKEQMEKNDFLEKDTIISDPYGIARKYLLKKNILGRGNYFPLRNNGSFGSILLIEENISEQKLCQEIEKDLQTLREAGWNVRGLSSLGRMSRDLLLSTVPIGCVADLRNGEIDKKVLSAAYRCIKGGRMECIKCGHFDTVYDYDLNKAYLFALDKMVSVKKDFIFWERSKVIRKDAIFGFCLCNVWIKRVKISPLCFRMSIPSREARLFYPVGKISGVWLTLQDLISLEKTADAKVEILEGVFGLPKREPIKLFSSTVKILEKAIKISPTNLVSDLASVLWGQTSHEEGLLYNPIYAATIPAIIRNAVMDMVSSVPLEKIIAIAIDGFASLVPADVKIGNNIGEVKMSKRKLLSLSDFFRHDYKTEKRWKITEEEVSIDMDNRKAIIPYGSSKRVGNRKLVLSDLIKETHEYSSPTKEDMVELYLSQKLPFPEI